MRVQLDQLTQAEDLNIIDEIMRERHPGMDDEEMEEAAAEAPQDQAPGAASAEPPSEAPQAHQVQQAQAPAHTQQAQAPVEAGLLATVKALLAGMSTQQQQLTRLLALTLSASARAHTRPPPFHATTQAPTVTRPADARCVRFAGTRNRSLASP